MAILNSSAGARSSGVRRCMRNLSVVAGLLSACGAAEGAACNDYPGSVRSTLKAKVEGLRMLEREAADRLRGLDTRTFDYLAGQARAAAGMIDDPKALADEDGLDRCSNPVPRVRRVCGIAALALVDVLQGQPAGAG